MFAGPGSAETKSPGRKAAPKDGPPQYCILGMLGLEGTFVRCLVALRLVLAPMSKLLPGLVIGGRLCLGSFEAPPAGGIRWC